MKRYDHLRAKAREWRDDGLSLPDICERLGLSKGTVHHWLKGLPLQRARKDSVGRNSPATRARQANCERRRDSAERHGFYEYVTLAAVPGFREFVMLFMTEGYRRTRHSVSVCNGNPALIKLASQWLTDCSRKPLHGLIQYHADQDPDQLRSFWSAAANVDPRRIRVVRKSNSGQLAGRVWRSTRGVFTVIVYDTAFRSRVAGWARAQEEELKLTG